MLHFSNYTKTQISLQILHNCIAKRIEIAIIAPSCDMTQIFPKY